MVKSRRWLTLQSPINAISMPAEAAATVSTRATARVRRYGPCRRQFEGSGADDPRSCTRRAVESEPGGRAMNCTFSRSATTHHTRADVRRPTVRPDRSGLRVSGRAEGQHGALTHRMGRRVQVGAVHRIHHVVDRVAVVDLPVRPAGVRPRRPSLSETAAPGAAAAAGPAAACGTSQSSSIGREVA